MIYLPNPQVVDNNWYTIVDNVFSDEHLRAIEEYKKNNEFQKAEVFNNLEQEEILEIRDSKIMWLEPKEILHPVYDSLSKMITYQNNFKWHYSLQFIETLQYTQYSDNGYYKYHTDGPPWDPGGNVRKLSFSVLMSESDSYQGGGFTFPTHDTIDLKFNQAVVFPGFMPHQVEPVTSGTRESIVGWVQGPNFT